VPVPVPVPVPMIVPIRVVRAGGLEMRQSGLQRIERNSVLVQT
jgi:hypothetical protein